MPATSGAGSSVGGVRLVAEVKLCPSPGQADVLSRTQRECNQAADWLSSRAHEPGATRRYDLHHAAYHDCRARFAIGAQATCLAIGRVAAAYKRERGVLHRFRDDGAVSFDSRLLRWGASSVSIWTVDGRQTIPFACGTRQRALLRHPVGESDLVTRDGRWYLQASVTIPTPDTYEPASFLGVDLGIVNVATDSDGRVWAGAHLNGLRHRHRRLRGRLQAKGTRSAKRLLKTRKRKEARMAKDVNHCISKQIIATAERTGRGIALEDLTGIRGRARARRPQRATLHSWAFHQLGTFIGYKAALAGVPVVYVDPRNTSRECPACGHVAKANRSTQAKFRCVRCSFAEGADHIAATNIARRAAVNRPNGSEGCGSGISHRQSFRSKLPASAGSS